MCGIVGFINEKYTKNNKEKIIKEMAEKIKHRGPDGEGYHIDELIAIGHKRLSIIDLENGKQPMYSKDSSLIITYNGEIYNYIELKEELTKLGHVFNSNSDTEVILEGFIEWGKNVVDHLRGMFAFAIWNNKTKELFMARDPFGIKPIYYTKMNNTFMFASEIKAFLPNPEFKKELNEKLLQSYLCYSFNPSNETFFKHVYMLPPGHTLKYKNGQITKEKYFTLSLEEKEENNQIEKITESLNNSIKKHLISDVEVGSFLSGGIDSSTIVSIGKINKTFTIGYENEKYSEIKKAEDFTKKLKIQNKSKNISKDEYIKEFKKIQYYFDEPIADPSSIPLYFLSELASKYVKVVMCGEGADELFGGYLSYKEEIDYKLYMKIPYIFRKTASIFASLLKDTWGLNFIYRRGQKLEDYYIGVGRVYRDNEALKLLKIKNQTKPETFTKEIYKLNKNKSNLIKRQSIDLNFFLTKNFLHTVDRTTMMFSIEGRTPFLDKEVYNIAKKLPDYLKINKKTTKIALREAVKNYLPEEVYSRKKLGFPVPLREWIKEDDLYNEIKIKFNNETAKKIFNSRKIIKLLMEHKRGKRDNYKKIWCIYTFLIWYEAYFS